MLALIVNGIIGLGMYLMIQYYEQISPTVIGICTLILFFASLYARLTLSKYYSFGRGMGVSLASLIMIPVFLWAAVIDLQALYIITKTLHPQGGALPEPWNYALIVIILLSLFVILREGVNAYSGKYTSASKQKISIANFVFLGYGLLCSTTLWHDSLDKLSFEWGVGGYWSNLFEAFLYYLVFLLPFERYFLIGQLRENKPFYLILLGLVSGFAIVIWTVLE